MADGGAPLPQQVTPGVNQPIVYSAAAGKASELNTRYQQAGGDIGKNYWEANPEIAKAASDPNRAKAGTVGYSDRADIQAWIKAQGGTSNPMVQRFLADQERRGLIRRAEGSGVTATSDNVRAAAAAGISPEELAKAEAYTRTAQAMPGGTSLQQDIQDASWNRDDRNTSSWQKDPTFGTDSSVPEVGLAGSQGLANAPNGPVDLRQAAAQAPWRGESPGVAGLNGEIGNFHTSDQIRAMNLAGDQALFDAKAQQAMATQQEAGATSEDPNFMVTDEPAHQLLNQYMQRAFGKNQVSGAYSNYQPPAGLF